MALILVESIGRSKRRASFDGFWDFAVVDRYRLTTNDATDTPVLWDNDVRIPQYGSAHPHATALDTRTTCLLRRKRYQEGDVQTKWELDCEYDTNAPDPSRETQDPLDEPPDITYDSERVEVAVQYDISTPPVLIANSARDPVDPPPTIEDSIKVVNIEMNVQSFDEADMDTYQHSANSASVWGKPVNAVLCTTIKAKRQYRNGVDYWRRSMTFKIQGPLQTVLTGGDWTKLRLLDMGYRQLVTTGGVQRPVAITSANGHALSKPVYLDGAGAAQPLNVPPNFVFLTFTVRKSVDFGPLNLPVI
jgi:hypothetical protein